MVTPRSPFGQGGSERHVREVSRRLAARGAAVEVLCAEGAPGEREADGVTVRTVRSWPAGRDYFFAPGIWRAMGRQRWDLVHVQSYHTLVAPLAMARALALGLPYVVSFHSGGHSSPLRQRLRGAQRRLLRPLLARASRLVAVARFELDLYAHELRLPRERFALVPNGVDLELGADGGDGGSEPDPAAPLLASIGRLERYKNHQAAIAALPGVLAQLPGARLRIVGSGPFERDLRRQAAALGVAERVEIGAIPAEDRAAMGRLLRETSLVVLMSEYETHPLVALEAAAAGRRLLVADRAGLGDVAREGLGRAIDPDAGAGALAEAILAELAGPAPAARPRLVSWDECAERLLAVYREVLAAAAASS